MFAEETTSHKGKTLWATASALTIIPKAPASTNLVQQKEKLCANRAYTINLRRFPKLF